MEGVFFLPDYREKGVALGIDKPVSSELFGKFRITYFAVLPYLVCQRSIVLTPGAILLSRYVRHKSCSP